MVERPWIVVGEVQEVTRHVPPLPSVKSEEDEYKLREWADKVSGGDPRIATVRIIRTLNGPQDVTRVNVSSFEDFGHGFYHQHPFHKGERLLFLLPDLPSTNAGTPPMEAVMLGLSSVKEVESQVLRARQFQTDYLNGLPPALLESARQLAAELRHAYREWPRPPGDEFHLRDSFSNDVACCAARDHWLKRFSAEDAELLYAVQAVDWMAPTWSRHPVWTAILEGYVAAHPGEARDISRKSILHALQRAGVAQPHADAYVKSDLYACDLVFPNRLETYVGNVDDREVWTTHLILSHADYFAVDNWRRLFFSRGRSLSPNLTRLRSTTIPPRDMIDAFRTANAENLDLLVAAFLDGEGDGDWRIARMLSESPGSNVLWKSFVKLGSDAAPSPFWRRMVDAKLFAPICIASALDILAGIEGRKPEPSAVLSILEKAGTGIRDQVEESIRALDPTPGEDIKEYLQAAIRNSLETRALRRMEKVPELETAAEFRGWFARHPENGKL